MDDTPAYRIKFIIIIQQLIDHLCYFEHLLLHSKPPNLVESFKLNDKKWGEMALTKDEIHDIMRKNIASTKSSS